VVIFAFIMPYFYFIIITKLNSGQREFTCRLWSLVYDVSCFSQSSLGIIWRTFQKERGLRADGFQPNSKLGMLDVFGP
jgi:hypothetical protein